MAGGILTGFACFTERRYLVLDRDGRLLWNLREIGDAIHTYEAAGKCDILSCLCDDDRDDLLMLLEKLKHSRKNTFEIIKKW